MALWALIIGVQDYPTITGGLAKSLPGTNTAAADFYDWVLDAKKVPSANIIGCGSAQCKWRTTGTTRKEIIAAFTDLVKRARDNADEVYIFFSGHGLGFSADPFDPAIDVLIGSDFAEPSLSGSACIQFQETKERFRAALGKGKHFYFIDACRNPMSSKDISPANLDVVWDRSLRSNATTYVFFSTAPGDVANVNSGFAGALLGGLRGTGRAKTWVGGKMYVTFESLREYLQRTLGKDDLDPEKRGQADGNIVEMKPTPTSMCDVVVIGAEAADQFKLKIVDVRQGQHGPIDFVGPKTTIPLPPEDYLLNLTTTAGVRVPQIEPPDNIDGVDLYDSCTVRFAKPIKGPAPREPRPGSPTGPQGPPPEPSFPEGEGRATESLFTVPTGNLRILGLSSGTELQLRQIATGSTKPLKIGVEDVFTTLTPGFYKIQLKDGNYKLASRSFRLLPGATLDLDFSPKLSKGAHVSLSSAVPTRGSRIDFSETLSDVPDWNLSLWLAVLGGSRILAAPDTFSKLRSIPLESFDDAEPGNSVLYVLAGELGDDVAPGCGIGASPTWRQMDSVRGIDGLFQWKTDLEPGPNLVTYATNRDDSTTIVVYGLPNRTTLLTFAHHEGQGRQVQQFILPTHSLNGYISQREREYLQHTRPLRMVRYMSTAQRLFALQSPIEGHAFEGSDSYWFDLLYDKWLDPVMALIACYELIRRGKAEEQKDTMTSVLHNMRQYFPSFADIDIIAMLLDEKFSFPQNPPLLMDGLLALGTRGTLPLSQERLEFTSIWTLWRNALSLRKARAVAR